MGLKLLLSAFGGIGLASSALAAGILMSGRESKDVKSSGSPEIVNAKGDLIASPKPKIFKKFSDLNPPVDGTQQCLIFYVDELSEPDNGTYEYEGYRETFKSKEEVMNRFKGQGLSDNDLLGLFCGTGYENRRYALSNEDNNWHLVSIQ